MSPKSGKVLVIGCGKMGEAIVSGWLAHGVFAAEDFAVMVATQQKREYLAKTYGLSCIDSLAECQTAPRMILLAVKPQVMPCILEELKACPWGSDTRAVLYVSIAAGLTTARIQDSLGFEASVVRVMPNVALQVGEGASTVCAGAFASEEQCDEVRELFALLGDAFVVEEPLMDVTTALNGSGSAYVARMIEQLRDAAVRNGLEAELAERLALQTVFGTAALMKEKGQSAEQTRLSVCSPGGTTLAALAAMENEGFEKALQAGVEAAIARSKELASCI